MKQLLTILLLSLTLTALAATPRYFLISYTYSGGAGSAGVFSNTYPKLTNVINLLRRTYSNQDMNIVVNNVMEFKSKADFDTFYSGRTYYDTVVAQKAAIVPPVVVVPAPATGDRTLYFHDLGVMPNTGQCLTDRVQQIIDSAMAQGGNTTLILSDSGTYNFTNAETFTSKNASVTIDVGCYPAGGGNGVNEIVIDKCH